MSKEYFSFRCRICGSAVYFADSEDQSREGSSDRGGMELTCCNGHTDQYAVSEVELARTRARSEVKGPMARVASAS